VQVAAVVVRIRLPALVAQVAAALVEMLYLARLQVEQQTQAAVVVVSTTVLVLRALVAPAL
jgi:hypothetical protein